MTPERWLQIDKVLQAALERPESQRAAFLDEACGGDEALRKEVESLLGFDERAQHFMEAPALEEVANGLVEDSAEPTAHKRLCPRRRAAYPVGTSTWVTAHEVWQNASQSRPFVLRAPRPRANPLSLIQIDILSHASHASPLSHFGVVVSYPGERYGNRPTAHSLGPKDTPASD